MTTGEVIRRVRRSIGMTQAELGKLINFSQPAISLLERGGPASYDVRILRLVARALEVPLAILVVESDEEADVDRRHFFRVGALGGASAAITAAVASQASNAAAGVRIGASDVADIQDSINQIHELDLVVGGDRLCHLAAGQVHYVKQLLDGGNYTENIGRGLATASAEMMTAAGWVHYDADRRDDARRFYADAVHTANAAGDGIAAAHALMNASVVDLNTPGLVQGASDSSQPRPQQAAHLAEAAQDAARRRGGPKLRSLAALREAQAQSVMDKSAMEQAISRAYRAHESGRGFDPEWVYLPEAEMHGLIGSSYMFAGLHAKASIHLQAAADASAEWAREQLGWQVYQAHNYIDAGDPGQACALLNANYATVGSVGSARLQRKLDAIATAVEPHADAPEVKEFLDRRAAV
ncbi:helix-turn-helix domain-containing protein [Nocardia nova]|uniref:helix-turn-helix domain-containing protein n=1 Tax=Nocardia nova TaxID=37330 RepID=UPI00273A2023|nr:helix-turn-helix transcriptional regulator [Nocardia nova]